jgi:hypothetical protein
MKKKGKGRGGAVISYKFGATKLVRPFKKW